MTVLTFVFGAFRSYIKSIKWYCTGLKVNNNAEVVVLDSTLKTTEQVSDWLFFEAQIRYWSIGRLHYITSIKTYVQTLGD